MSSDGGRDYHAWAKFPASAIAFGEVKRLAASDSAFMAIFFRHVADGICTDDGKLLKIYRNQQWVAA